MLINLFQTVRSSGVPCTLRELLDLLGALEKQMVYANIDDFYYLSRTILVKDEKHYDKFDKAFDILMNESSLEFDEIIKAEDLCDLKELERLRLSLDQQVFNFKSLINILMSFLKTDLIFLLASTLKK